MENDVLFDEEQSTYLVVKLGPELDPGRCNVDLINLATGSLRLWICHGDLPFVMGVLRGVHTLKEGM